jgi:hypothetical protein
MGRTASISGPSKTPCRAWSSFIRTAAANSGESASRAPVQCGTTEVASLDFLTQAVMSRTRTNFRVRPAKVKTSLGRSRAMKFSSTVPMVLPRTNRTFIAASLTMVPMDIRCRIAAPRSRMTWSPSRSTTLLYSG